MSESFNHNFELPPVEKIQEEREGVLRKRLERRNGLVNLLAKSFPKLKSLVFAFVATTMSLSTLDTDKNTINNTTIENSANPSFQNEKKEQSIEEALAIIHNPETLEYFEKIRGQILSNDSDFLPNSSYHNIFTVLEVNNGYEDKEINYGRLPGSLDRPAMIGRRNKFVYYDGNISSAGGEAIDYIEGSRNEFYIIPVEPGSIIEEGGTFKIQGTGATFDQALINTLEEAVDLLNGQQTVEGEKKIVDENIGLTSASNSVSMSKTMTKQGECLITGYQIISGGEPNVLGDGSVEYNLVLEIKSGKLTELKTISNE